MKRGLLTYRLDTDESGHINGPCWRVTSAGWLSLAMLKEAGYNVLPPERRGEARCLTK